MKLINVVEKMNGAVLHNHFVKKFKPPVIDKYMKALSGYTDFYRQDNTYTFDKGFSDLGSTGLEIHNVNLDPKTLNAFGYTVEKTCELSILPNDIRSELGHILVGNYREYTKPEFKSSIPEGKESYLPLHLEAMKDKSSWKKFILDMYAQQWEEYNSISSPEESLYGNIYLGDFGNIYKTDDPLIPVGKRNLLNTPFTQWFNCRFKSPFYDILTLELALLVIKGYDMQYVPNSDPEDGWYGWFEPSNVVESYNTLKHGWNILSTSYKDIPKMRHLADTENCFLVFQNGLIYKGNKSESQDIQKMIDGNMRVYNKYVKNMVLN